MVQVIFVIQIKICEKEYLSEYSCFRKVPMRKDGSVHEERFFSIQIGSSQDAEISNILDAFHLKFELSVSILIAFVSEWITHLRS